MFLFRVRHLNQAYIANLSQAWLIGVETKLIVNSQGLRGDATFVANFGCDKDSALTFCMLIYGYVTITHTNFCGNVRTPSLKSKSYQGGQLPILNIEFR